MNTLKKVLLALLLVGVSVNADLQAMKRPRPTTSIAEGVKVAGRHNRNKVARHTEENDSAPEQAQDPARESDEDEYSSDLDSEEEIYILGINFEEEEDGARFEEEEDRARELRQDAFESAQQLLRDAVLSEDAAQPDHPKVPRNFNFGSWKQGLLKVGRLLFIRPGPVSAFFFANLPYEKFPALGNLNYLTIPYFGFYVPYYIVKKMVIESIYNKAREKGWNCWMFNSLDTATTWVRQHRGGGFLLKIV